MRIITVDFDQDIITAALQELCPRSILVFPSRPSAKQARLRFEARWQLEELIWTTMQDFKTMLTATPLPQLQDEKRLLCLYQVLSEEEKDYFHISQYGDVVDWGNHFFRFLEGYCEAGHDVLQLCSLPENIEINLKGWQEKHVSYLSGIIEKYHQKVTELGFTDQIFQSDFAERGIPFQDYRIIFVNQYYYSNREVELIRSCAQVNEILLIYHGAKSDEGIWPRCEFEPGKIFEKLADKPEICIRECENEDQHALALLAHIQSGSGGAIIDHSFVAKPYSAWFDETVKSRQDLPIIRSTWYALLSFFNDLAQSQLQTPGYLPLRTMISHLRDPRFLAMLMPTWEPEMQDALMRELFALSGEGVLYLDIDPARQFGDPPPAQSRYQLLPQLCQRTFSLVQDILNLHNCKDLADLLESGLDPQKLCSENELNKTDVLQKIWTAMANFTAIEELGVVTDWRDIFGQVGTGLFDLWLDFIKTARLRLLREPRERPWEITNLLDMRNRRIDRLAFMQMVEGSVPQSPDPVWLLNERQRKKLGMICYEDIRDWERYYFFRLVFTAREACIFSYRNAVRNIEPSSFIGELMQIYEASESADLLDFAVQPRFCVRDIFHANRPDLVETRKLWERKISQDFFRLPVEPDQDFAPHRLIRQTSYGLGLLIKNPFAWYISSHRKLDSRLAELEEKISPILFGTLMHSYFNDILGEKPSRHQDLSELEGVFTDREALSIRLRELIKSPHFRYKIPKNYNAEFLDAIISNSMAESLQQFYHNFLKPRFSAGSFTLIPEEPYMTKQEQEFRQLCEVEHSGHHYKVMARGKADLRIETPHKKVIVDFKTGSASEEQLIVYEYLYYLIDRPEPDFHLQSFFWQILKMGIDSKSYRVARNRKAFIGNVQDALRSCLTEGYGIAQKSAGKRILSQITRADLYLEKGEEQ